MFPWLRVPVPNHLPTDVSLTHVLLPRNLSGKLVMRPGKQ
jgi:hypothetical protein